MIILKKFHVSSCDITLKTQQWAFVQWAMITSEMMRVISVKGKLSGICSDPRPRRCRNHRPIAEYDNADDLFSIQRTTNTKKQRASSHKTRADILILKLKWRWRGTPDARRLTKHHCAELPYLWVYNTDSFLLSLCLTGFIHQRCEDPDFYLLLLVLCPFLFSLMMFFFVCFPFTFLLLRVCFIDCQNIYTGILLG